ncbi:hypothetical protein [Gimesia sp.]|uniref:hypothetical protein n=1 Tax=Gimesia sp. TaxID=2024833 RepID=UPI003A8E2CBB
MSSSLKQLKQRWLTDSPSRIGFILRLLLLGLITTVFYYRLSDPVLLQTRSGTEKLVYLEID